MAEIAEIFFSDWFTVYVTQIARMARIFCSRGLQGFCPAEKAEMAEIWLDSLALAAAGHIATPAVAKVPVLIVHELEVREGEFFLN